jgi:hypothetical protein
MAAQMGGLIHFRLTPLMTHSMANSCTVGDNAIALLNAGCSDEKRVCSEGLCDVWPAIRMA